MGKQNWTHLSCNGAQTRLTMDEKKYGKALNLWPIFIDHYMSKLNIIRSRKNWNQSR